MKITPIKNTNLTIRSYKSLGRMQKQLLNTQPKWNFELYKILTKGKFKKKIMRIKNY